MEMNESIKALQNEPPTFSIEYSTNKSKRTIQVKFLMFYQRTAQIVHKCCINGQLKRCINNVSNWQLQYRNERTLKNASTDSLRYVSESYLFLCQTGVS